MLNHESAKDFYSRFAHRCLDLMTGTIIVNAVFARRHFTENVAVLATTIAGLYVLVGIYLWIRGFAKKS
jgi:hypothetical protein